MANLNSDDVPNGASRLIPILGDPIAQVKSPNGMTRGFVERGHNALCVPIHVTPADLDRFIAGVNTARNVDGMIITIPHKFAAVRHCATLSARAKFLEAANILRRNADGTWHGDMADGLGFVTAAKARGGDPRGKQALLVGAGGAGSAIGLALIDAGVTALAVYDGDSARRDALIARLAKHSATPVTAGSSDPTGFGFVANATPAGMKDGDPMPIDVAKLAPETFCACVITKPLPSPWLVAAEQWGCRTSNGGDMYAAVQEIMFDFFLRDAGSR